MIMDLFLSIKHLYKKLFHVFTLFILIYLLQLLPDNVVDPMELLSYLDPPDLATPPSSGASSTGNTGSTPGNTTSDDILALFE